MSNPTNRPKPRGKKMEQAVEIVSLRRRKGGKKEPYDICFATKGKEWKVFYDFFPFLPKFVPGDIIFILAMM